MTEGAGDLEDIIVVTNVGPSILRSYFAPLAALPCVKRLTIVRDRPFEEFAPNVEWCPSSPASASTPRRICGRIIAIVRLLRRRRPTQLMVMHWFPDGYYLFPLARLFRVPLMAHVIGGTAEIDGGARKIALSHLPGAVKRAAFVLTRAMLNRIASITYTGSATLERFGIRGVAGPAMFVARPLVPCDENPRLLHERSVDVVYVGRIDADKRFDRFLRVIAALAATRSKLTVHVCGVARQDVDSHAETASVAMPGNVEIAFLGHVADVRPYLRGARVFMLSSDSEGLSLAMLEAMGCGTVPVVTDVGDMGVVLAESGGGVAISLGRDERANTASMAAAAARMLDDDHEWAARAAAGHAYVRHEYSKASTERRWWAILRATRRRSARA